MSGLRPFWFLWFGGLGILFPYYSLYLKENGGLTAPQVGLVMASLPLVGILAQPLWGQVADRSGRRARLLALVALGAAACCGVLGQLRGFGPILLGTAALAVFFTSVVPMATATTLAGLGARGIEGFGAVRVLGTVGFLAAVVAFPWILKRLEPSDSVPGEVAHPGLGAMFWIVAALWLAAALAASRVREEGAIALRAPRRDWRRLLAHGPVVRLVLVVFAANACIQGPIGLFPLFLSARGGDASTVGRMWFLMLLPEIALIAASGSILRRFGPRWLLTLGLASEGVRWTVSALAPSLAWVYAVQVLHGFGVTGVLVGVPLYLERAVPERLRSTGQAMVAMAGVGAGAMVSNAAVGWLLARLGADLPYLAAGLGALALAVLLRLVLPLPHRPEE